MKNTLQIMILILLSFVTSLSFAQWEKGTLRTASNRVIHFEQFKSRSPGPTLLFLPGIYRGQMSSDDWTSELVKAQIPFVFMHFAEQPDSVVQTSTQKAPDFSEVDANALAHEVESIAVQLKLENAIPVSLSYSAVVTAHLDPKMFPVVIETSPIAKQTDGLPDAIRQYYEFWEAWMKAVPFGRQWLLATKKIQLHQHWANWLQNYKERLPKLNDPVYFERAIQGYTALTLAADDFDLRNQDFQKGPARYFILGAKELSYRSAIQQQAIQKYQDETGHLDSAIVIPEAGHIVMQDQPESYVEALREVLEKLK